MLEMTGKEAVKDNLQLNGNGNGSKKDRSASWSPSIYAALRPVFHLLDDPLVNEVKVFDYNKVYTKGAYSRSFKHCEGVGWSSRERLFTACSAIGGYIERVVNDKKPIFDGSLPTGERVNIIMPPLTAIAPHISIRKFTENTMTIDMLKGYKSIDDDLADMLISLVHLRRNILVAGGTESGKTSLLNALIGQVGNDDMIATIEDSRELKIDRDLVVSMITRESWREDYEEIDQRKLVMASLRVTPDRIIVGEVRDSEAFDLIRVLSTGHRGGMSTIHSNSAGDGLLQLQTLAGLSGRTIGHHTLADLVGRAIDIVIYVKKMDEDGSRKITQIIQVDERDPIVFVNNAPRFRYRVIAQFKSSGLVKAMKEGLSVLELTGGWIYPSRPSTTLMQSLEHFNSVPGRVPIKWPKASFKADDIVQTV